MRATQASTEQAAIDALEPGWKRNGYTLIREPVADQLPAFLRGFKPDAIAVGSEPSLVIEVLARGGSAAETKLKQLRSLFSDQKNWRLEIVYALSNDSILKTVNLKDVTSSLAKARHLNETDPRTALLLAWASLEAISRLIEPELARHSLSSGSLIDLLISTGRLLEPEGDLVRTLGSLRNAISHGQIDISPNRNDVADLIEMAERLSRNNRADSSEP